MSRYPAQFRGKVFELFAGCRPVHRGERPGLTRAEPGEPAAAKDRIRELADEAQILTRERFSSSTDPKILAVPTTAWITNPGEGTKQKLAAETHAGLIAAAARFTAGNVLRSQRSFG